MNIYRFLYSSYVDIKANSEEEAQQIFDELDLDPTMRTRNKTYAYGFRDVLEIYPITTDGVRIQ